MNVVFILSDQHNPFFSGCYGNSITRTPAIDSIAERGVRFENAYCASPLCVPTRGAMFTGRYVHEVGTWDNALAWTGAPSGWSHHFRDSGVGLTTVGKLDFKPDVDHGIEGVWTSTRCSASRRSCRATPSGGRCRRRGLGTTILS